MRSHAIGPSSMTLSALLVFLACSRGEADEPADLLQALQGRWVRQQHSERGPVTLIKEHVGNRTVVTAYDEQQNVLYSHKSEFKVERADKVNVLTFFNRTITAGPQAGQVIADPVSFVYRVANGNFIEVYGVLDDDPSGPKMLVWRKERKPKDAA